MSERARQFDPERVRLAVRELLLGLGYDPDSSPAVRDTPGRVARAWAEATAGDRADVEAILAADFPLEGYDELVLAKGIPFDSTCEHHLLPFSGVAHVAYVPGEGQHRVVGFSKLARLVDAHARRLQLQERLTMGVAADLQRFLKPRGVGVVVEAAHLCACARGVSKQGMTMVTSDMRGCFRDKPAARAELLALIK